MNDPRGDALPEWTQDELTLLRSADDDRPNARSLPATLAAVGVGSAIAAGAATAQAVGVGTSALTATKWGGAVAISKWITVAAVGAGVIAGAGMLTTREAKRPATAAHTAHRTEEAAKRAPVTQVAEPAPALLGAAAPAAPAAPMPSQLTAKKALPSQPDIRVELAAIDAAMATLRAGDAAAALAALDRYDASFGRGGSLRLEASALRIEALARVGQREKAEALAHAFLAKHAKSPYAARIRAVLGSGSSAPAAP